MIESFKNKYELEVNELDPDAGSGDEIEAIKANKGNKGPQAPDVIDVGLVFGPSSKAEGLIQPYKVATWDTIPDERQGCRWLLVRRLLRRARLRGEHRHRQERAAGLGGPPEAGIRGQVALAGDPRVSNQAILSVYRGRPVATGGDADQAAEAGLKFFAELNKAGNFVPVDRQGGAAGAGRDADHHPLGLSGARRPRHAGRQPEGRDRRPEDRRGRRRLRAGDQRLCAAPQRRQAVDGAPLFRRRPAVWLKGYCHPIRFNDLVKNGKVPQELLDKLPPAEHYENALFPTLDQQAKNKEIVTQQWDAVVGANIQ